MNKHTPGPWSFRVYTTANEAKIAEYRAVGLEPVRLLSNDGQASVMAGTDSDEPGPIARVECRTTFKRGEGHRSKCEERDANARLISAAPDLLAALQAVLAVADRKTDEFDLARAAIAKALG